MANDLNLFVCIGRLGRDPEVRYMPNGDAAVNISLAVGKSWKDKNSGEKKESTTWVPVSFFGKTAEIIGEYCKKGSQLQISGEFSVRKYTKDGEEKTITEIRGDRMQLLSSPQGSGGAQQTGSAPRAAAPAQRQAPAPSGGGGGYGPVDDDIPFAPCRMWF